MSIVKQVVTANRLRDGVPVYYAGRETWTAAINEALPVTEADGETLLAEAQGGAAPVTVVAPYLIEVTAEPGATRPIGLRETIRAFGPTVDFSAA